MRSLASRIIHEETDFLVLDKPAHLLIHPTKPNGPRTLWSELCELLAFGIKNGRQVSLINRLDRETTGLVLVAKNSATAPGLGRLAHRHPAAKLYHAITRAWLCAAQYTVDN